MCQACVGLADVLPERAELERTIALVEQEMIAEEVPPMARPLQAVGRVAEKLDLQRDVALTHGPLADPVIAYFDARYTRAQLAMPFPYVGALFLKGTLYEFRVPIIYGKDVPVDLFGCVRDLPAARRSELAQPGEDLNLFLDQFVDMMDFGQGNLDLPHLGLHAEALELLQAGKSHAEASAAAALRGSDGESALHAAFLASEVNLKGLLRAGGRSLRDLRRTGHDLTALVQDAASRYSGLASDALLRAIALLPAGVGTRYQVKEYGLRETGHAVMAMQFIGAEVMRQLTTRDARAKLRRGGTLTRPVRVFP